MSKYKLYTKTGDDGTTGLFSGKRVSKHHVRIKAYGTVDELNAWIGLIRNDKIAAETNSFLIKIQNELMVIASQLADDTSEKTPKLSGKIVPIAFENVTEIESEIDKINNELPELKNFIIPGGHVLISYTHLARCTCRRAERFITELNGEEEVSNVIIAYINRLSDYLFILARKLSKDFEVEEIKWIAKKNK
ncbi:cob(I)yrinic acid a,c-diamide adenosyltransferase [Flavobacteriaceae bacterium]|nr:cob(I)yrinic acid a,c-diamide adenosyltransferase [Flavobacteriaceae bacterium]